MVLKLPKLRVASSSLVCRSFENQAVMPCVTAFFIAYILKHIAYFALFCSIFYLCGANLVQIFVL